ncbi:MAG: hypothetical protein JO210_05965 [Acidobacteriaceae bacterium]|nr:hypothetical protein [Acidobacteriaceae bacterium]
METENEERLASLLLRHYEEFDTALLDQKRRYPITEFRAFAQTAHRYLNGRQGDSFVRMDIVRLFYHLAETLQSERKRIPAEVLWEAERLECLLFAGYDPHFKGDEPPGL